MRIPVDQEWTLVRAPRRRNSECWTRATESLRGESQRELARSSCLVSRPQYNTAQHHSEVQDSGLTQPTSNSIPAYYSCNHSDHYHIFRSWQLFCVSCICVSFMLTLCLPRSTLMWKCPQLVHLFRSTPCSWNFISKEHNIACVHARGNLAIMKLA